MSRRLKLMTYNIHSGVGVDGRYDLGRIRRVLNDEQPDIAALSRKHNDSNVLVLPSRFVSEEQGVEIMKAWLGADFEGGRHQRRVDKIEARDRL